MKDLLILIRALPEIIKLIQNIQKKIDEAQTNRKVKEDLQQINKAFETNDAEELRKIFNG